MAGGSRRPFVDTNVLFSALYREVGAPAHLLRQHLVGQVTIVVSRQVLEELGTTIRAKRPELLDRVQRLLSLAPPEVVADPSPTDVERVTRFINAADAPILAAALACGADCIVTGNTRHFTSDVARAAGIEIVTPAAYVAVLGADPG